jgi:hypothetical protein
MRKQGRKLVTEKGQIVNVLIVRILGPTIGFSPTLTALRTVTTVDKGHGRIEQRTLRVSEELKGYLLYWCAKFGHEIGFSW